MLMGMKPALRLASILLSSAALLGGSAVSAQTANAVTLSAPVPYGQQVAATTMNVSFAAAANAATYRVQVWQGSAIVFDKTSTSRKVNVPIVKTPKTVYVYRVGSVNGSSRVYSAAKSLTTRAAYTPVKFVTYNLCAEAQHCPTLVAWSTRVKNVATQVKAQSPDVFTVQQAGTIGTHVPQLSAALGSAYTKVAGSNARYIYFNNTTMAKTTYDGSTLPAGTFTVQATSTSKLTYVPYSVLRQKSTNARFLVVNLHLTSLDSSSSDTARLGEMKQTVAKIAATQSKFPGIPTVYAGDFNSLARRHVAPYESDLNRYRVAEYLKTLNFTDAVGIATTTVNAQLSSFNPEPDDLRNFGPSFHLDHFFVNPGTVDAPGTTVSSWGLANRDVAFNSQYSDHDMTYMVANLPTF